MRSFKTCIIAVAVLCAAIATASAAPRASSAIIECTRQGCLPVQMWQTTAGVERVITDANGSIVGARPVGCPRKFCGCEASLFLFGKIIPELNLAARWLKFPRTSPAPRMVAARPGHVFVLIAHHDGSEWLVRDGNSGGGLTREHVRSIRGYVIVNPHAEYSPERLVGRQNRP